MTDILIEQPTAPTPDRPARPGWAIVTDLTPPELIASRRLRALQRLIVIALVGVVLLCAAGVAAAYLSHRKDTEALETAKSRSAALDAEQRSYGTVTGLQAQVAAIDTGLTTLMGTRVPVADVITRVRAALPHTMAITGMTVSVSGSAGTTSNSGTSSGDDAGTVTLDGTAAHLVDVATYIAALGRIIGVADVVPSNNVTGPAGTATWSITFRLTTAVTQATPATTGSK